MEEVASLEAPYFFFNLLTCRLAYIYGIFGIYIYGIMYIYIVFTTEGLLEVAIESWPDWDLNPRPLNSVQTL